ncbi:MAG TPA: AsmA-like C-terminal domain-containing protein, partial [Stellaceae bacterium]|nr:AsmA-like C-terminal domain-containing protein [Stellaceae bacterium]
RAYGGAIGVNVDGNVDYQAGTLDASGTLVPANILNTVLGNIPVIGSLILGGDRQGIFAANFRIAGPIGDPQVAVNPLSAIAPGALRRLFVFKAWNPAPASKGSSPQSPPQTPPQGDPGSPSGG